MSFTQDPYTHNPYTHNTLFATRLEMKGACQSFFFLSAFRLSPAHFVISFVYVCAHARMYVWQILHLFSELKHTGPNPSNASARSQHVSKFVELSLPTIVAMRECVCTPLRGFTLTWKSRRQRGLRRCLAPSLALGSLDARPAPLHP